MSWSLVARKDFEDGIRAKTLWLVSGLFVLLMGGAVYAPSAILDADITADQAITFLGGPTNTVLPIVALAGGYMAIVGERESGSIKILLSLPFTRRDVVLGKLVGRYAIVSLGILAGFIVAFVAAKPAYGSFPSIAPFGGYVLATLLLGAAFVSIAIGISAFVSTRNRAMAAVIATYVLFNGFWGVVTTGLHYLLKGGTPSGSELPAWYVFLERVNPIKAFSVLSQSIVETTGTGIQLSASGSAQSTAQSTAGRIAGEAPIYLTDWATVALLIAWVVVPIFVGYVHFNRSDIY